MMDAEDTTIKAVVFDVGGVIYLNDNGNSLKKIATALDIPFDDFRDEYFKNNHRANIENEPWNDVVLSVVKKFDQRAEAESTALEIFAEYDAARYVNEDLFDIFKSLRKAGYKLGIISNAGKHLRKELEKDGIAELVDEIVISGEVGHQKPGKEIFDILFEKLGLDAEDVIFVDDSLKSLEKADEIGYVPVRFTDNESLIHDMKDLGLEIKR